MEYTTFIQKVRDLGFIKDDATADAAIKAVLGILTSDLREPQAHALTRMLPQPLNYQKLRGHQKRSAIVIPTQEYVAEIQAQFHLTADEAKKLITTILHVTKDSLDKDTLDELTTKLPPDWARLLQGS